MNASQMIAWLICLALAFFGAALALHASYRAHILEARFDAAITSVDERNEVLQEIGATLRDIRAELRDDDAAPSGPAPAGD